MSEQSKGIKRIILKVGLLFSTVLTIMIATNFFVDPANLFHDSVVDDMADLLLHGSIVESPGNYDEGALLARMLSGMQETPELFVVGSSHVMYCPWEELDDSVYNGGLSGSYLGDYYAGVGAFLYYRHRLPEKIIIGVDPWAFYTDALSGRHTSIKEYAKYMKSYMGSIEGYESEELNTISDTGVERIKGLLSVSYFQASVRTLYQKLMYGEFGKDRLEKSVKVVFDKSVGERQKRLPNGRLVMPKTGFNSVEEIETNVAEMLASGHIYRLENGFVSASYDNIKEFYKLIDYLMENGTEVELYLPSWYPSVYTYFSNREEFVGVLELESLLRDYAKLRGIKVHGSYNPYACGIIKEDYANWLHLKADKVMTNYHVVLECK